MRFVLRMAVRETRASWRRLLFFFLCIAVGVGAIVALRSVIQNVRGVLDRRGAHADRRRRARQQPAAAGRRRPQRASTRALAAAGATARTETIETATMVRPADGGQGGGEDGGAAGGAAGLSALRHARAARRAAVLARRCCATAACSCGRSCSTAARRRGRRPTPHRRHAVHDPRRHRERAGRRRRRLQPRPARARRLRRRSAATGLLSFGSRARLRADGCGCRSRASSRSTASLRGGPPGTRSSTSRSFRRPRTRSARTSQRAENYLSLVGS